MNDLEFAKNIDDRRKRIEDRFAPMIKIVLKNLNQDAYNLFLSNGNIPARILAKNATPEFTSIIRDVMRFTANEFGFELRRGQEKEVSKSFYTKADNLDLLLTDQQLRDLNRSLADKMLIFIANESERQALFIENTNFEKIEKAQQDAILKSARKIQNLRELIFETNLNISQLVAQELITGIKNNKIDKLRLDLAQYERFLERLIENRNEDIAKAIKDDLDQKSEARSKLIASQVSGMTEGEARNVELIELAIITGLNLFKRWIGILDDRQRQTHRLATGQEVAFDQKFIVGGYPCSYPMDSSLPISETANCRCVYRVFSRPN